MRRHLLALLAVAVVAATGCASVAGDARPLAATNRTTTQTIKVKDQVRSYLQVTPLGQDPGPIPIIVVLSGISATAEDELARDGLLGLPASGRAELVYPVSYHKSWNAGGCCGQAAKHHVDDLAFVQALVAKLDPGRTRPIYLAGYSNGGRLAYRVACTDPSLFDGYAVVKAMPDRGCVVSKPVSILQIDSTNDYAVPYQPGDKGKEQPPATTEVAHLRDVDGCAASTELTQGGLRLTTWSGCRDHTQLLFASYTGGKHSWPLNTATTPGAPALIWRLITG